MLLIVVLKIKESSESGKSKKNSADTKLAILEINGILVIRVLILDIRTLFQPNR